jgi:hypothetical protein
MRFQSDDDCELKEASSTGLIQNPKHPLYHLFNFIAREYGNSPETMVKRLVGILGMEAVEGLVKNKSWKKALKAFRYTLTAGILGTEFLLKLQNYVRDMRREKADASERRVYLISDLLKIPKEDPLYGNIPHFNIEKSPTLAQWLLSSPELSTAKIMGYYVLPSLQEIPVVDMKPMESVKIAVLVEHEGNSFAYEITLRMGLFGAYDRCQMTVYGMQLNEETYQRLESALLLEFAKTLEIEKNIIRFESTGCMMFAEPRRLMNDSLNQFDMESCGIKEKNKITGAFLECIDEVNEGLNMVIMYTVNDTSLIHRTIINRPGRSDKVIEIFPPRTPEEALTVLGTRLKRIQDIYHFTIPEGLFKNHQILNVMEKCVHEDFTQAEITNAVVEQAVIDMGVDRVEYSLPNFIEYLNRAVAHQLDTRQAIRNCNFNNEDYPELKSNEAMIETPKEETIGFFGSPGR